MITYISKKNFVLDQMDHLNFKIELDSKHPSKEKKEIIESRNRIYKKPDKVLLPDKIQETLYSEAEKIKKLSKEINLKGVTLIYQNVFILFSKHDKKSGKKYLYKRFNIWARKKFIKKHPSQNDILRFVLLCTKKETISKKRKMSYEIIDIIQITGLQNFDNYQKLKPIEMPVDSNKIVDYLLN